MERQAGKAALPAVQESILEEMKSWKYQEDVKDFWRIYKAALDGEREFRIHQYVWCDLTIEEDIGFWSAWLGDGDDHRIDYVEHLDKLVWFIVQRKWAD
jgi:hypothetical protein